MRKTLLIIFLFISIHSDAQTNYWQQYLHYSIKATLNDKEKTISGTEAIIYKNNSPETLNYIWFHLYPNAYRDKSTAFFKQLKNDPDGGAVSKKYLGGFISLINFSVNGIPAITQEDLKGYPDVVKLILPQSLLSGDSITISTPFKVQLPYYFSRSGYSDGEFIVCQWYPKPAVFDKNGWHEMPYLDTGEFYSEYASYDVDITVPDDYVVAASGVLQTSAELFSYKKAGTYNNTNRNERRQKYSSSFGEQNKTLTYHADSVPDFAWFADKRFLINYDTMQLASGKVVDVFTYYHDKNSPWQNSIDFVKDAVRHYGKWIGEYDYPVVQAVEGPGNQSSGGMEYPMITLITMPYANEELLDGVIAHEVGHNWFMSMLGTNERDHAWMDEGLNSYFEFRYEAEKYRSNEVFGDKIPLEIKKLNEQEFLTAVYKNLMQIPDQWPIETKSADFTNSSEYSTTEYIKTAEWLYLLENAIGTGAVDKAFQNYFRLWKFKHPQPEDMKAAFEQALDKSLNQYFSLLHKEGRLVE
jgi:hypothetical protein